MFFNCGQSRKSPPSLRCPSGCKTGEADVKLGRDSGPQRPGLSRWLQCGRDCSARRASVLAGFPTEEQTLSRVVKARAAGNGLRACARSFERDKHTGARILEPAARQCQKVSAPLSKA